MSRAYSDNQTLQQKIITGANILADNVASTLGPRGRNVLLQENGKQPFITKDGVTVAQFVALDDPFENAGAQILRQAAIETNNTAGDGTTTSTVLARAILRESQKFITSGVSPIELQRGIDLAVGEVVTNLNAAALPVRSVSEIEQVATISANNDSTIGKLIATAIDKVGQDGAITIEESRTQSTSLDITEGFRFDSGYCAGAFITDPRRAIMVHQDPLILVTDHKINAVEEILPVLEMIARESRPLVVVAEEVEGQALAAMIMNAMRGSLKVCAIKAPYYGEERRQTLRDLALATGATFISRESGTKLSDVQMVNLGSAVTIESTKYKTTIIGGNCDHELIETQIAALKEEIQQTDSLQICETIQSRIVRLSSGVAVIHVGGSTEVEMIERKHRIEDALSAVRSAQEEGIIPGGGTALLRASQSIVVTTNSTEQALGITIVSAACREPLRQMALNSGQSADIIIEQVLNSEQNMGWNFITQEVDNLLDSGVIDPVKVTRTALQNAASCAGTLITTNYGIIQTEAD